MEITGDNSKHHSSPFQDRVDVSLFYEQCRRRPLLNEVKTAIFDSVPFLVLLGEGGSGKSMLCKMVERELSSHCLVVFYRSAVESFEDVIRPVALKMGISIDEEVKREELNKLLSEVPIQLQQENRKLLLIFDEAEKIFLATLERIRKMLDIVNENGIYLQVLFSGENSLQANLQQLSLCTFQGATERTFSLQPIDEAETLGYLNLRLRHSEIKEDLFTREHGARIFAAAQGNFARTNSEARKSVPDSSPVVPISPALENVHDTSRRKRKKLKWTRISFPGWFKRSESLAGAGVLVAIVILVIVLLNRGNHSTPVDSRGERKPPVIKQKIIQPDEQKVIAPVKNVTKEKPDDKKDQKAAAPQKQKVVNKNKEKKKQAKQKTAVDKEPVEKNQKESRQVKPDPKGPIVSKIETQPFIVISSESSRLISQKPASAEVSFNSLQKESVDRLFNKRVAATAVWPINMDSGLYTVQLMVLSSERAEENVKKILMRQEYQDISDQLFILRALGPPPSVSVFYGEYTSKVSARIGRNNLPIFLRKHDPYITSVKDAVEKAGAGM